MRVLGIDPGSIICGYGIIEKVGNSLVLIEYGVIEAKKKEETFPLRLKNIYERLEQVIERTLPDEAAFESIFYAKNVQSMMKLAHARAVAMLAATMKEIPVVEYSTKEVKKSVTGRGAADKEQVRFMVKKILNISDDHKFLDATDALAVAICHINRSSLPHGKSSNWKDFIKNHPERVKGL